MFQPHQQVQKCTVSTIRALCSGMLWQKRQQARVAQNAGGRTLNCSPVSSLRRCFESAVLGVFHAFTSAKQSGSRK